MTDISDAYESSYTIMLNLNKSWVQKAGGLLRGIPYCIVHGDNMVLEVV